MIPMRRPAQPNTHAAAAAAPGRIDAIDALRAGALLWMAGYHFVFDLNTFGLVRQDFYRDPVWTLQRTAILSLFMFCAGFGQALAVANGQGWPRFWRRWGMVAGCALLVSAGSWLMFPRSFIFFGVLHGLALMLILARLTAGWGAWCLLPALLALAAPLLAADALQRSGWEALFNGPALSWLGLVTRKPVTEDYVPLLPWMGVVWIGVASARLWPAGGLPATAWRAQSAAGTLMVWLGRRSLAFYMLHQPVLIAAIWLFTAATR